MTGTDLVEKAAKALPFKPIFELDGKEIQLVCLLPHSPPLVAHWWRGKEMNLLGVDVDGNFFLRHCDGSVRYWTHTEQKEVVVAKSVNDFVRRLREDINDKLRWWRRRGE